MFSRTDRSDDRISLILDSNSVYENLNSGVKSIVAGGKLVKFVFKLSEVEGK